VPSRAFLIKLIRLAVTAGILLLLWQAIDGPAALALLLRAEPLWLALAVLALTGQTVLSALRWRLTARALGQVIPVRRALREYYLSQIVNQSLPGGVLGDAGRAVRARHEAGLKRAGQAVVFERLAGQIALFAVTLAAVIVVILQPGPVLLPSWVVNMVVAAGLTLMLIGLFLWMVSKGTKPANRHVRDWIDGFTSAVLAPAVLPRQILLSLGTTALNLLAFALCAYATGTTLPILAAIIIVPLILFTMLIPISVSGWGLREGAAAALFPVIGATATQGFAASLAFGLMFLLSVLPGVLVLLMRAEQKSPETGSVSR
jgi:glycosyltransferase 2 family protein